MRGLWALALLPFLFCASLTVNGQTPLQIGMPIERSVTSGQTHEFTVTLAENSFVQLVLEQKGVDVVIRVSAPDNKNVGEFDSPTGAEGTEHVSFVGLTAGTYRVSVSPFKPDNSASGSFEIKLMEIREATDQEIKDASSRDVVKAKGLALLRELEGLIQQIRSPQTRIKAQLRATQLLWQSDQKRASQYLNDAVAGVKELLATSDPGEPDYRKVYPVIMQLRFEIAHALVRFDVDGALNFIQSTALPNSPYGNSLEEQMQETNLELFVANEIANKDPNRAVEIARRTLKKRFSTSLTQTLAQLRTNSPELAIELAGEIASKLGGEQLLRNFEATNLAIGLIQLGRSVNSRAGSETASETTPRAALLTNEQVRSLLQKLATEALSYSPSASPSYGPERVAALTILSTLQQFGPEVNSLVTGGKATIDKKMTELMPDPVTTVQVIDGSANVSWQAAVAAINKEPAEQRQQLYNELANREANKGDFARARQILNDNITNPYQRLALLQNLNQHQIQVALIKGKTEEALRIIATIRSPRERARHLLQVINSIGESEKRAAAIRLLEQVRDLLPPAAQAQDQDHMQLLFNLARAFSRYDAKRSFEIMEPLIDQLNELCAAARTMDGFGPDYYDNDELEMHNGSSVANAANEMAQVMGMLALKNFERARGAADRVRLPEVRLSFYMEIAQRAMSDEQR